MSQNRKMSLLLLANIISAIGSGISAFTIPWLIINMNEGEKIYGLLFISVTITIFFLSPYIGVIIDNFPRKKILLYCEILAAIIFGVLLTNYFFSGEFSLWILIIMTIVSSLYNAIQIPTLMAFTQSIFTQKEYKKVNSLMEVQGQTATFLSAGLVALLLGKVDIWLIFLLDIFTFILAFSILLFIPYQNNSTSREAVINEDKPILKMYKDIKVALKYIRENTALMIFILCTFLPFIMVITGNYINPVYVYKELEKGPEIVGYSSVIYALSAMTGGVVVAYLSKRFGDYSSTYITYSIFIIGIVGIVMFPFVSAFLLMRVFAGVGNAGTRVLRRNIMMDKIPNEIMGRVNSFINSFSLLMQSIIVGFFSFSIGSFGASTSFITIIFILLIGLILMISSHHYYKRKSSVLQHQNSVVQHKN